MLMERLAAEALGKYLEGLDRNTVNISFRQGRCRLTRCSVRPSAWSHLGLPFRIRRISFDELELHLSWSWARFESTAALGLKGVRIELEPFVDQTTGSAVPKEVRAAALAAKRRAVRNLLARDARQGAKHGAAHNPSRNAGEQHADASSSASQRVDQTDAGPADSEGWAARLLSKLIRSARLTVQDVKVSWSDAHATCSPCPTELALVASAITLSDADNVPHSSLIQAASPGSDSLFAKQFSAEGFQLTVNDSVCLEPTGLTATAVVDRFTLSAELAVQVESMRLPSITPGILQQLHALARSLEDPQAWLEQHTNPLPQSPMSRFRWATWRVRRQVRLARRWRTPDSHPLRADYIEYFTQPPPRLPPPPWLDHLELQAPQSALARWQRQAAANAASLAVMPQSPWREWFDTLATQFRAEVTEHRPSMSSLPQTPDDSYPPTASSTASISSSSDAAGQNVSWVALLRLSAVQIELLDDHGFHICRVDGAASALIARTRRRSSLHLYMDSLNIATYANSAGSMAPLLGPRGATTVSASAHHLSQDVAAEDELHDHLSQDVADDELHDLGPAQSNADVQEHDFNSLNGGDDDFFDAESEGEHDHEEQFLSRASALMRPDALVRVVVEQSTDSNDPVSLTLVVEPVEVLCHPESWGRLGLLARSFAAVVASLRPRHRPISLDSSTQESLLPILRIRFGAPAIGIFASNGTDLTAVLEPGNLVLDTLPARRSDDHTGQIAGQDLRYSVSLRGSRFLTISSPSRPVPDPVPIAFDSKSLLAFSAVGPFDAELEITSSSCGQKLAAECSLAIADYAGTQQSALSVSSGSYQSFRDLLRTFADISTVASEAALRPRQQVAVCLSEDEESRRTLPHSIGLKASLLHPLRLVVLDGNFRTTLKVSVEQISGEMCIESGKFANAQLSFQSFACREPGPELELLKPVSLDISGQPGSWQCRFLSSLTVAWEPSVLTAISSNIFDVISFDDQLQSVSLMLQSNLAAVGPPRVGRPWSASFFIPSMHLSLLKDHDPLFAVELLEPNVQVSLTPPSTLSGHIQLRDVRVLDLFSSLGPRADGNRLVVSTAQGSEPFITSKFTLAACSRQRTEATITTTCTRALRVVYWQPFVSECLDYFSNGVVDVVSCMASSTLAGSSTAETKSLLSFSLAAGPVEVCAPIRNREDSERVVFTVRNINIAPLEHVAQIGTSATLQGLELFVSSLATDESDSDSNPILCHDRVQIKLWTNPAPKEGEDRLFIDVQCGNPRFALSRASLSSLAICMQSNLLDKTTLLTALGAHERNAQGQVIRYWKSLVEQMMHWRKTRIFADTVSIVLLELDSLCLTMERVDATLRSRLVPHSQGFETDHTFSVSHTSLASPSEPPLCGGPRDFSWFFGASCVDMPTCSMFARAANDPSKKVLAVSLAIDNLCIGIYLEQAQRLASYAHDVHSRIARGTPSRSSSISSRDQNHQSKVCIELEVSDARVLLPSDPSDVTTSSCLEGLFSAVGSIESQFTKSQRQLEKGLMQVDARVNMSRERPTIDGTCRTESRQMDVEGGDGFGFDASQDFMGMTMTQSMLLGAGAGGSGMGPSPAVDVGARSHDAIVAPFTFDLVWDVPFDKCDFTQQVRFVQTSDIACIISPSNLGPMLQLTHQWARLESSTRSAPGSNAPLDETCFEIAFPEGSLGLALGPSARFADTALEVRGYAPQCEENITRSVLPGDVLDAVNGEELVGLQSLSSAKERLRSASVPRMVRFRRLLSPRPCDPLLYTPVSTNAWVCRVCTALQPLPKRTRPQSLTCSQCNAVHERRESKSDVSLRHQAIPEPELREGAVIRVETFENQRSYLLLGWSANLLPGDPPSWSDMEGALSTPFDEIDLTLPSSHLPGTAWQWMDTWSIDKGSGDEQGWVYAKSFAGLTRSRAELRRKRRRKAKRADCVRRRCWVRHRILRFINPSSVDKALAVHEDNGPLATPAPDMETQDTSQMREEHVEEDEDDRQLALIFESNNYRCSVTLAEESAAAPLARVFLPPQQLAWIRLMRSDRLIRVAGNLVLAAEYFNLAILDWEPFLEPWPMAFELLRQEEVHNTTVLGMERLSINLTVALLTAMNRLQELLSHTLTTASSLDSTGGQTMGARTSFLARLVNHSGVILTSSYDGRSSELEPDESVSLVAVDSALSWTTRERPISVQLFGGWRPIDDLYITREGSIALALEEANSTGAKRFGARVMVSVTTENGCRTLTVSSLVRVVNRGGVPVSLRLRKSTGSAIMLGECSAGGTIHLPALRDLNDRELHVTLALQGAEKHGYFVPLEQLQSVVRHACLKNLATASTAGLVAQRTLVEISPMRWLVIQTEAKAIENCYASSRSGQAPASRRYPAPAEHHVSRRTATVGSRYSTCDVTIAVCSPLVFHNGLGVDLHVRMRATCAMGGQGARVIAAGESWFVDFVDHPSNFEWSARLPSISEDESGWSAWSKVCSDSSPSRAEMRFSLSDSLGATLLLKLLIELDFEEDGGATLASLDIVPIWQVDDCTSLALQVGTLTKVTGSEADLVHARPVPSQSDICTIVVCEHERWQPIIGWTSPSLPRDPPHWEYDRNTGSGTEAVELDSVPVLPEHTWADPEWRCEPPAKEVKSGHEAAVNVPIWSYAVDFSGTDWHAKRGRLDIVRRRVWKRSCVRFTPATKKQTDQNRAGAKALTSAGSSGSRNQAISSRSGGAGERTIVGDLSDPAGVCFRMGGGRWSAAIGVSSLRPASHHVLEIEDGSNRDVTLPVVIHVGDEQCCTVHSRFKIYNLLQAGDLWLSQCSVAARVSDAPDTISRRAGLTHVAPGQAMDLLWHGDLRFVRFGRKLLDGRVYWSGPVDIAIIDEFVVSLRVHGDYGRGLVRIKVTEVHPHKSLRIEVRECTDPPMYRIENRTLHTVVCLQDSDYGRDLLPFFVKDRRSCAFGWDTMTKTSQPRLALQLRALDEDDTGGLLVAATAAKSGTVFVNLMEDINTAPSRVASPVEGEHVHVRVYSEGQTKVVCIMHPWSEVDAPEVLREFITSSFRVELNAGATLSVVDHRELAAVHIEGALATMSRSQVLRKFEVTVRAVSVDDADPYSTIPSILTSKPAERTANATSEGRFFSAMLFAYSAKRQHGRFKFVSVRAGDFEVRLARQQVKSLSWFAQRAAQALVASSATQDVAEKLPTPNAGPEWRGTYFDLLHLHPISFRLTLTPAITTDPVAADHDAAVARASLPSLAETGQAGGSPTRRAASTSQSRDSSFASPNNVSALEVVSAAISRVTDIGRESRGDAQLPFWAVALDHMLRGELRRQRIKLSGIVLGHVRVDDWQTNQVTEHYRFQIGTELASTALITSEMLERPINLVRSLGRGVGDVLQRKSSLSSGARGLVGGAATISESIFGGLAHSLATMSLSNEYLLRRQEQAESFRHLSSEGGSGAVVSRGLTLVREGVTEGVAGLVTEPFKGVRKRGTVGFIGGLGKGVVGVALKPVMGVLDAATLASQAMRQNRAAEASSEAPGFASEQPRVRRPRAIYGPERRLRIFDEYDAEAASTLRQVDFGRYRFDMFCGKVRMDLPEGDAGGSARLYVVSTRRIVAIDPSEPAMSVWVLRLRDVAAVTVRQDSQNRVWGIHLRANLASVGGQESASRFIRCGKDKLRADAALEIVVFALRQLW